MENRQKKKKVILNSDQLALITSCLNERKKRINDLHWTIIPHLNLDSNDSQVLQSIRGAERLVDKALEQLNALYVAQFEPEKR